MEISYHTLYALKFIRRINKNTRIFASARNKSVFVRERLQSPYARSTYRYNAPALTLCRIYLLGVLLGYFAIFHVHFMLFYLVGFYRTESHQPYVKINFGKLHAFTF